MVLAEYKYIPFSHLMTETGHFLIILCLKSSKLWTRSKISHAYCNIMEFSPYQLLFHLRRTKGTVVQM